MALSHRRVTRQRLFSARVQPFRIFFVFDCEFERPHFIHSNPWPWAIVSPTCRITLIKWFTITGSRCLISWAVVWRPLLKVLPQFPELRQQSSHSALSWKKWDITGRQALGWTRSRDSVSGWPTIKLPNLLKQHCWPEPAALWKKKVNQYSTLNMHLNENKTNWVQWMKSRQSYLSCFNFTLISLSLLLISSFFPLHSGAS